MKKIHTLGALVATFALSMTLVACGGSGANEAKPADDGAAQETKTEAVTPEAAASLTINTEGMGQIAWAYEGEKIKFDKDFPFQSAVINDASGKKILMEAKADKGWKFVKWTKDGEDFSTEKQVEVEVNGSAAYVAVFESK
ncbi:MAG: hypothetical protein J6S63_03005 [Atopobiaceae bacterium]|nr:hypothetical protein [Atopobiaceae bacterium]